MKIIAILFLAVCCVAANWAVAESASVKPFLVLFGSKPRLTEQHIPLLAENELILIDRFRFHQINNNTWKAIKTVSPNTKIYLYQLGPKMAADHDSHSVYFLNNLGRFDDSREPSSGGLSKPSVGGGLNKKSPDWFLKNNAGKRITGERSNVFLLDFGNEDFVDYWIKHTLEDITDQKWRADGIYIDEATACNESTLKKIADRAPSKYLSCENWDKDMNQYLAQVSSKLHNKNQLVAANRGNSRHESASEAWKNLDKISKPLDVLIEEGAFAVHWGDGDVQFMPVEEWQRQVDMPASIRHSAIGMMSQTDLAPNKSGTDSNGEPVTYDQVMRFATGSYLLARNASGPTTYFVFVGNRQAEGYDRVISSETYSEFDIGTPLAKYKQVMGQGVYLRQYSDGYIYVNPTDKKANNIRVAAGYKPVTLTNNLRRVGSTWFLDLPAHDSSIAKPIGPTSFPSTPSVTIK